MVGEVQDLQVAGSWGFASVRAVGGRRSIWGCFSEEAMGEGPGPSWGGVVVGC